MKKVLIALLLVTTMAAKAQTEPEYRLEIGGGIGALTYLGDFNGGIFTNVQPMGSLLAKYRMNPRTALALNVSYGQLKGESNNAKTYYPEWKDYSFTTSLIDTGVRLEYNFWPFGTGQEYRGAKRITPYIYIGLGATIAKPDEARKQERDSTKYTARWWSKIQDDRQSKPRCRMDNALHRQRHARRNKRPIRH